MQILQEGSAASRLNTLSMRLIDGGLKRLLTHQAHHIVNALWPSIETALATGEQVTIPWILEQNRFDFAENLSNLKGIKKAAKPKKNSIIPTMVRMVETAL